MKRILLLAVAMMLTGSAAFAQVIKYEINEKEIQRKIAASDKAIENEKRALRGTTWIERGDAFYEAASAVAYNIFPGLPYDRLIEERGKPTSESEETVNDKVYKVVHYPFADIYLDATTNAVLFWKEKIVIVEGALEKAAEAYKKAAELDPKQKEKAKIGLQNVAETYKQHGHNVYQFGNSTDGAALWLEAADFWKDAYELQLDPIVGVVDSLAIFNTGYIYLSQNDYPKAIESLEKSREVNYWSEGNVAYYLSYAYLRSEQHDKAKAVLMQAMELFPENQSVVEGLINYYILSGEDMSEIKDVVIRAVERDPDNIPLLNSLGQIYVNAKDTDKIIEVYTKMSKMDPYNFASYYYIGDAWIDKGNAEMDALKDSYQSMSDSESKAKLKEVNEVYRKSLPFLEKAYEIQPDEIAVVSRLRQIYSRFEDEPEMVKLAAKFDKILDEMDAARGN